MDDTPPHFSYSFDFLIETAEYRADRISRPEILHTWKHIWETSRVINSLPNYPGGCYYYAIGYSPRKRFLQLVVNFDGATIHFLQARVADEEDVMRDFCTRC